MIKKHLFTVFIAIAKNGQTFRKAECEERVQQVLSCSEMQQNSSKIPHVS